eukprot:SAG31_NODE_11302_length_1044_cov_0.917460_1_plen_241_part_10
MWNESLAQPFLRTGDKTMSATAFVMPVISGHIGMATSIPVRGGGGAVIGLGLVSRRSKLRAGTRLNTRGVDRAGNPANFVETEQLMWCDDRHHKRLLAFTQVRGSVPVFWAQEPDLSYNPPIAFRADVDSSTGEGRAAVRAHFEQLRADYPGLQLCVSLLDGSGGEHRLQKAFEDAVHVLNNTEMQAPADRASREASTADAKHGFTSSSDPFGNSSKIELIPFDFHKACSRMRYENIGELL